MSIRLRSGAAALLAAAVLFGTTGAAHAADPPFEPDPGSSGALTFYDASGNQITGGSTADAPFAVYVKASAAGAAGDTKATLFGYTPNAALPTGAWSGEQLSLSTNYPDATAPAPLDTATTPLVKLTSADLGLADLQNDIPNPASTGPYQNLYQLRLKTSGPSGASPGYQSADVLITGSTWTVVYPAIVAAPTTTTLNVSPASPQTVGANVTLTATVTAGVAGTVQFKDGTTDIGSPVTVAGGAASTSTTGLGVATHSLTAVFTPTNTTLHAPSTSPAVTYVINGVPATVTDVSLAVNTGTSTAFAPVTFTATVNPAAAPGTVTFSEGATVLGTTAAGSGTFTLTTSALGQGSHAITADFTPTNAALFTASTVTGTPFVLGAPAYAPASGTITAQIAAGTLVISTPYTPAAPLDLGPLTLNSAGTQYSGSATFSGITVTDTRAGNLPWNVSALASNLTSGGAGVINGQNVGLTGLTADPVPGNALTAASVTTTDNPAASPAVAPADPGSLGLGGTPHPVLHADNGTGSIAFHGLLTLNAPTSAAAGTYTGNITFTIG